MLQSPSNFNQHEHLHDMSKTFEVQGELHSIGETTSYGQNGFTKREFVIKLTGEGENSQYPNYVALELIKDKCALLDTCQVGQEITAHFNLSGRLWSAPGKPEKCFTSLQAWRIETGASAQAPSQPAPSDFENFDQSNSAFDEDIPF